MDDFPQDVIEALRGVYDPDNVRTWPFFPVVMPVNAEGQVVNSVWSHLGRFRVEDKYHRMLRHFGCLDAFLP